MFWKFLFNSTFVNWFTSFCTHSHTYQTRHLHTAPHNCLKTAQMPHSHNQLKRWPSLQYFCLLTSLHPLWRTGESSIYLFDLCFVYLLYYYYWAFHTTTKTHVINSVETYCISLTSVVSQSLQWYWNILRSGWPGKCQRLQTAFTSGFIILFVVSMTF